ncbi:MAG: hypothetical protein HC771_17720 [Synechococcales cyanobacterium CRU_2_2]|nr:hypothetical protein [Synechococcales cyanobacterium CRU_2_2]
MAAGRYKSRLLNYLVEQAQQIQSQTARGLRQARTGLVWGAQILLYPLYVAFQASRVVGRQMGRAAAAPRQLIQPPETQSADQPLKNVLKRAQMLADQGAIQGAIAR